MARRTFPLNDLSIKKTIRTAKTENKIVKSFDGGGLFLLVDKSGNTGWRFKYRINNKEKLISFGVYPDVSLADARKQRSEARELIAKGVDPSLSRKMQKNERSNQQKNTFQSVAEEWLSKRIDLADITRNRIERCLKHDILPAIGNVPVSLITPNCYLRKFYVPWRGVMSSTLHTGSGRSFLRRFAMALPAGYLTGIVLSTCVVPSHLSSDST